MGNKCCTDSIVERNNQIDPIYAVCSLESTNNTKVSGTVYFKQEGSVTKIFAKVKGLCKGKHGFHIHEFGNLSEGCKSAGVHFNPTNSNHGDPKSKIRHVGDLGNIESNHSNDVEFTEYLIKDSLIALEGPNNVLGRSCVVHQDEDDLGLGTHADSKTTGHSGVRVACGVIGLSDKFNFDF